MNSAECNVSLQTHQHVAATRRSLRYSRPALEADGVEGAAEGGDLGVLLRGLLDGEPLLLLAGRVLGGLVDGVREQLVRAHDVRHEAWLGDHVVEGLLHILHAVLVRRSSAIVN